MASPLREGEALVHAFSPGPLSLGGLKVEHEASEHWYRGEVSR